MPSSDKKAGKYTREILIAIGLIALSCILYYLQIVFFNASRDTFFYLMQDVAFLPIQVLLVSVILERLLNMREKRAMMEKLNMAIGIFYSETGNALLRSFTRFAPMDAQFIDGIKTITAWKAKDYATWKETATQYTHKVKCSSDDLAELKSFLMLKKEFLLALLQNPNLLEHDSFTDTLRAVFHLTEELDSRTDVTKLPPVDHAHIEGDIRRVCGFLVIEWIAYMEYLGREYPYLFSLSARMNPFNPEATPVVEK